jgi:hypothetical protein
MDKPLQCFFIQMNNDTYHTMPAKTIRDEGIEFTVKPR